MRLDLRCDDVESSHGDWLTVQLPGTKIHIGVYSKVKRLSSQCEIEQLPAGGVDLEELEKDLLRQALERTRGNRTRAAQLLSLSRDTLRYRIEKYHMSDVGGIKDR